MSQGSFAEAIKQRLLSQSDPDAQVTKAAMVGFVKDQEEQLRQTYLASYERIGHMIEEAKANQADGNTLATLKLMQDGYAKRIAG